MFAVEFQFRVLKKMGGQAMTDAVDGLIVALQCNGQVLSDEWPIALRGTVIRAYVSIPERTSLQRKHESKGVAEQREAVSEAGLSNPTYSILGHEPATLNPCKCMRPSAFILCTDFLSMESPLRCADCFDPRSLYRMPPTSDCGAHEDIVSWRRNYQYCDALHIGSAVGDRFGVRQLSSHDSDLSKEGLECCRRIADVTGNPCYYYIYRYYGRSKRQETQRACPSCGKKWRLQEAWHKRFDFRCVRCHLISNLAYSVT